MEELREKRLTLLRQALAGRSFTLCIDETGDKKKGKTTDYVASQYIGNLGKVANGIVSVNAYGVLDDSTFPLTFRVYKPKTRLSPEDTYIQQGVYPAYITWEVYLRNQERLAENAALGLAKRMRPQGAQG